MKKIAALAFLISLNAAAQGYEKACSIFTRINEVLQERHYQPKPVDDTLSAYVFTTVMEELDDNHMLFLQSEYNRLQDHKYKIDDYLKSGDCSFFGDFIVAYKNALEREKRYVEELDKEILPLNSNDTIFYAKKSFPYHEKGQSIKDFLRKKLTFDILEDVAKLSQDKDSLAVHLTELGKQARQKVFDAKLCSINLLLNPSEGFDESVYNRFFAAFCNWFDPHSTYFNYNQKATFVSTISSDNYSLGLYVSQNGNNEIVVEEVVPGGPAFISGRIDKGDQLLKVRVNNKEYEVSCASMETISEIVFSDTYKTVQLTLRKKDGTVYSVNLEKQIMKADENAVYSFVLGEGKDAVGYIKIPSFYSGVDEAHPYGCADDVAAEVVKLKKQDIGGLIIDLQYNGGGSMDEVIRMAGMFINFGPVSVVTERGQTYNTIRDYNRGMLYEGPMVVLVNGFTASASEFFAGVMQDYNRAVIVGNTTVGKATMQTIIPLEQENPTDFVKVTIDKFYRITGKSNQYIGIVPDIQLPWLYDKLMVRESAMPTAMKNDTIDIRLRFAKMPSDVIKKAVGLSKNRIVKDAGLNNIKAISDTINRLYNEEKPPLPVTFDAVFKDVHQMDTLWGNIADTTEKESDIKVSTEKDTGKKDAGMIYSVIDDYKAKSVKADPYIPESINILHDLHNLMHNR